MDPEEATGEVTTEVESNALGGNAVETPAPAETSHPWDSYVEKFPEGVRGIARESFSELEKNFNGQFQKVHEQYRPFKNFIDQKVDPERLNAAYQFATQFEADPQQFVTYLAEHLGLTIQQAQAVAEAVADDESTTEENPEIASLREQQEQFMQQVLQHQQAQEAEKINQEADANLRDELVEIESKYGKMTDVVRNEVLNRALAMSYQTNKPISLMDAYESLERFVGQVQSAPRPGASAPRVLSSGSAVPITPSGKSLGQMSNKETKAAAGAVVARMLAEQE